jgi:hypothetical protein
MKRRFAEAAWTISHHRGAATLEIQTSHAAVQKGHTRRVITASPDIVLRLRPARGTIQRRDSGSP